MKIGEFILKDVDIVLNEGRNTKKVKVSNTGDRAVQVGSHFHFFEINRCIKFEREQHNRSCKTFRL